MKIDTRSTTTSSPPIFTLLTTFLLFLLPSLISASSPSTASIYIQPVSSTSSPAKLAEIEYIVPSGGQKRETDAVSTSAKVLKWFDPVVAKEEGEDAFVRVGVLRTNIDDVDDVVNGIVVAASRFGDKKKKLGLRIFVDEVGEVWNVGLFSPLALGDDDGEAVAVEVASLGEGPRPVLNRPVVVKEGGEAEEEVVEKTFLQKYWWIFLAVVVLMVGGGGDK